MGSPVVLKQTTNSGMKSDWSITQKVALFLAHNIAVIVSYDKAPNILDHTQEYPTALF